jgi:hypothetical protein
MLGPAVCRPSCGLTPHQSALWALPPACKYPCVRQAGCDQNLQGKELGGHCGIFWHGWCYGAAWWRTRRLAATEHFSAGRLLTCGVQRACIFWVRQPQAQKVTPVLKAGVILILCPHVQLVPVVQQLQGGGGQGWGGGGHGAGGGRIACSSGWAVSRSSRSSSSGGGGQQQTGAAFCCALLSCAPECPPAPAATPGAALGHPPGHSRAAGPDKRGRGRCGAMWGCLDAAQRVQEESMVAGNILEPCLTSRCVGLSRGAPGQRCSRTTARHVGLCGAYGRRPVAVAPCPRTSFASPFNHDPPSTTQASPTHLRLLGHARVEICAEVALVYMEDLWAGAGARLSVRVGMGGRCPRGSGG